MLEVWNGKLWSTQTGGHSTNRENCLTPTGTPIATFLPHFTSKASWFESGQEGRIRHTQFTLALFAAAASLLVLRKRAATTAVPSIALQRESLEKAVSSFSRENL